MLSRHTASFKNAFNGLIWVLKTQPNFKIHISLSLLAILGGFFFQISNDEFLIVFVLIGLGLVIETVNTAIEETIDAFDKNPREEIRIAKDVSAAAMLIFAMTSFIIACIIFIPKL